MKKIRSKKIGAAVIAVLMAALVMTGCKDKQGGEETETSATSLIDTPVSEYNTDTRPIADGDDYAINKINNKSPEDSLPGGYKLISFSEEQQGKLFVNGKSEIIIRAYNYKEDLVEMATWADSACAAIVVSNITSARDTDFGDPENVTVCGFDGIRYENVMIQYTQFGEDNRPIEEGSYRLKGRYYFFFTEQDAYVLMFDTREEDWDEQVKLFEEFVKDLEITKTEY